MKKLSALFCGFIFSTSLFSQIPTAGLIAHYPFCGNASDKSSNAYNGTLLGPVLTSDRFGNLNGAYRFDGINDYIDLPATAFVGLNVYSYSIWMRPTSIATTAYIAYSVGSSTQPYCLSVNYNPPAVFAGSYNGGSNPVQSYIYSSSLPINSWIHVVVSRDLTTMKMYVNGVLTQQSGIPNTNNQIADYGIGPHKAVIGARSTLQNYFQGDLDDVRIYSTVLSQSDVTNLYNEVVLSGSANKGIASGETFAVNQETGLFFSGEQTPAVLLITNNSNKTTTNLGCKASEQTGLEVHSEKTADCILFPNPNSGNFSITFDAKVQGNFQFVITDLQGRIIKTIEDKLSEGTVKINEFMPAGIYTGELLLNGKSICKKKICIVSQ